MVSRIGSAAIACALACNGARADFHTGEDLHEICTSGDGGDIAACDAFIAAVADALLDPGVTLPSHRICLPEGIEIEAIVDPFVHQLRTMADRDRHSAVRIVAEALAARFPCRPR